MAISQYDNSLDPRVCEEMRLLKKYDKIGVFERIIAECKRTNSVVVYQLTGSKLLYLEGVSFVDPEALGLEFVPVVRRGRLSLTDPLDRQVVPDPGPIESMELEAMMVDWRRRNAIYAECETWDEELFRRVLAVTDLSPEMAYCTTNLIVHKQDNCARKILLVGGATDVEIESLTTTWKYLPKYFALTKALLERNRVEARPIEVV